MSNFFSEIDEEVRLDKIKKFWFKYRHKVLLLCVSSFLLIGVITYYKSINEKEASRLAGEYLQSLDYLYQNNEEAKVKFEELALNNNSIYSVLANLNLASISSDKGDLDAALNFIEKSLSGLSSKDPLYRFAYFNGTLMILNMDKNKALEDRVETISSFGGYWVMLSLELKAYMLMQKNNLKEALEVLERIYNEERSSQGSKFRAKEMIDAIKISGKI